MSAAIFRVGDMWVCRLNGAWMRYYHSLGEAMRVLYFAETYGQGDYVERLDDGG
jgi:hypothetical protein